MVINHLRPYYERYEVDRAITPIKLNLSLFYDEYNLEQMMEIPATAPISIMTAIHFNPTDSIAKEIGLLTFS